MPFSRCLPAPQGRSASDRPPGPSHNQTQPAAFARFGEEVHVSRPWPAALLTSSILCIALGMVAVMVVTASKDLIAPPAEPVSLTFVEHIPKPSLPGTGIKEKAENPPPAKLPSIPRRAAPAAAAVVSKNMKARKLDVPPSPRELVAPQAMPQAPPKEAEPSEDKDIPMYGHPASGDPAGLEGGQGNGAGSRTGDVGLPEGAIPPRPHKSNQPPRYPLSAMASHKVGKVLLRYLVHADGAVTDIEVLRGEEPFASEAVTAVRRWRYDPARYNGQPISVSHVIELRFRFDR
jgi:periplasmic protein TonB